MRLQSLIPWNHNRHRNHRDTFPFGLVSRRFDGLFDEFFGDFGRFPSTDLAARVSAFRPSVNVSETAKSIHIEAELPGLDEKDVEVVLADGVLTIRGEKKASSDQNAGDYGYRECAHGSFERSLALPDHVDTDRVAAKFKNGILTIDIQKKKDARQSGRRISISTN